MEAKNKEQTDKEKALEREKYQASKNTFKDSRDSNTKKQDIIITKERRNEIGLVEQLVQSDLFELSLDILLNRK